MRTAALPRIGMRWATENVIYVDAEGDASGAGAKPVSAAGSPLPATASRVKIVPFDGHAAWREAAGKTDLPDWRINAVR